jgi:glycosyltransferase involved in cell wall biosynthesis
VIWGEGPERGNLEKLIKEKSLEGRVLLPGRTKKIHEEMAKGSLFVLSSRFEGMPNALCEAMSLGLPVISTDCPTGPREVITHGEDGMLVPVDDVQEMARAMEDLIKDVRLREKLGEKASQKMKQYDMETISALWEKVFDEVV